MSALPLDCTAAWSPEDGWLFMVNRKLSVSELWALAKKEWTNLKALWEKLPDSDPKKDEFGRSLKDLERGRIKAMVNPEARGNVFKPFLQ